jgi:hypothetical protein
VGFLPEGCIELGVVEDHAACDEAAVYCKVHCDCLGGGADSS